MREAPVTLLFPFLVLCGYLIEPRVAQVTAGVYLPLVHGLADCAAWLLQVSAVVKAALAYVWPELREAELQFFLWYGRQLLHIEGGKARRVCHEGSARREDLDVPSRMAASAQLFADYAGLKPKSGLQSVQQAGFAHAGVAGKGADLAGYAAAQLLHALPRDGARLYDPVAAGGVDVAQAAHPGCVGLVDADEHLAAHVLREGRDPVNEEGVRHRIHLGGNCDQQVDICDGGTYEEVLPRQQLVYPALSVSVERYLHPVPDERGRAVQPETAACSALDRSAFSFDIVEAAEGLYDDALHQFMNT